MNPEILKILKNALTEDIGSGDVTTLAIVPETKELRGYLLSKADGVIAGLEIFAEVFLQLDQRCRFDLHFSDGQQVHPGDVICRFTGPGRAILSGERTALNILQRMSGIATQTQDLAGRIRHTRAVLLDTRKTVPGLRLLDKLAVRLGGGSNHRFGLYDMVMIKDNHISAAGSIPAAVEAVHSYDREKRPIEVEVKNLAELAEVLPLKVDRILLDNMTPEQLRAAVRLSAGRVPLEASGNVRAETIAEIAETGVDYISVGSVTHSVKALDISLLIEETGKK